MSVVEFKRPEKPETQHWAGTVRCLGCHHEWVAAAPMGSLWLECPECGLPKGHPKHPFGAQVGDTLLTCTGCRGEAFTAYYREGHLWVRCMGCGDDLTEAFYA